MRHCRSIDSEYNRSLIGNFYNAIFEDIQDRLPVLGVFSIQRGKRFSVCGQQQGKKVQKVQRASSPGNPVV